MLDSDNTATRRWGKRATCALASTALIATGAIALGGAADAVTPGPVYVSNGGQDVAGCGTTQQSQCKTIQYGVDQASAGQTVQVAAGTYTGPVSITKALTLQGAGRASTVITGLNQPAPANGAGLVAISQPGGDVTVDGFTITDPVLGSGYQPYSLSIGDASASDTITVSNNAFSGDPDSQADSDAGPLGVDSADTSATQLVTGNDFSGLYQGVLMEGSDGPVTVSDNNFHDLIPTSDGNSGFYPAEGVYFLGDKNVTATDQDTVDNTFESYGGIGVAYRAGYDLGGCTAPTVCTGSVSGSITGNTFALAATTTNNPLFPAAALRLQAKYAGDALDVTVGGNAGTVVAPTLPIIEQPVSGATITVTPTDTPNTITTNPAPTISTAVPASITTAEPATAFSGTATNPSGEALSSLRYDVTITGTSGITASQLDLEYDNGAGFQSVPLTGTASAGHAITGYFGPLGGFTFPAGYNPTTDFTLAVPSAAAPGGTLAVTISLDQVSSGTGNPAIDTLASESHSVTVVQNSAPVATSSTVTTPLNTSTPITLSASDADSDALLYTHTNPAHGSLSGSGANLTYTPDTDYVGSDSFSFTVTDNKGGDSTATVTIDVGKATSALAITVAPTTVTTGTAPTVTVAVTRTPGFGTVNGGTVILTGATANGTTFGYRTTVANGQAVFSLPLLPAGAVGLTASFSGTSTTTAVEQTAGFSVVKVTPRFTYVTSPTTVKASTSGTSKVIVTVVSDGARATAATGQLVFGTTVVSTAKVSTTNTVTLTLPTLSAGKHTLHFNYLGNANTNPSTKLIVVQVAKG